MQEPQPHVMTEGKRHNWRERDLGVVGFVGKQQKGKKESLRHGEKMF